MIEDVSLLSKYNDPSNADVASRTAFIWTSACGAQLEARYRHGRGTAEVDRSADPSSFGYRGKHRYHLDITTPLPTRTLFLPISIPRQPTRRKGVGEGEARTHPHILYCTRCAGCCRQHEVNRLLETGNSSFFATFKLKPGLSQLVHTPPRSGRSIAR